MIDPAQASESQIVERFVDFYNANLRPGFFVGFLTVATFLFSALTQLLFRMKETVYDAPSYRERHRNAANQPGFKDTIYGPLRRFKRLLLLSICAALLTSVIQLLVLWIDTDWSAVIALCCAIITLVLLAVCVYQMWANLHDWLRFAEADALQEAKGEVDLDDDR